MINLFSRFLLIISFLILLPENSFAQNIFDDLKKAGEQLQKGLETPDTKQKPSPTSGQPSAPKPPAASPQSSTSKPASSSKDALSIIDEHQFTLFDIKIGDPIQSAKLTGKGYSEDYLIKGGGDFIRGYTNQFFTPKTKNDLFDEYLITYGPYTKKIVGIYAKTKKTYKTVDECDKDLKDPSKFIQNRLTKDNPKWTFQGNPNSFIAFNSEFNKAMNYNSERDMVKGAMVFKTACQLNNPGYIFLRRHNDDPRGPELVYQEQQKFLKEKEQKDFEKKKDTGKLKGL